jgi:hypothetical protein
MNWKSLLLAMTFLSPPAMGAGPGLPPVPIPLEPGKY